MSKQPWSCDRSLDVTGVRSLLASQYPAFASRDVRYLAEGWDNEAYEVDGTWVVRFPKRVECEADLKVEAALLPALAAHLARSPAHVQIPVFDFVGVPSELFPYRWAGYRKLLGLQGHEVAPEQLSLPRFAASLGQALSAVHAFPAAEALALGVPDGMESRKIEKMRDRALVRLPEVEHALGPALTARVRAELVAERTPAEHAGPQVLVHNDILDEHLLFDPRALEMTGIIDWADTALGDPAVDFAGVHAWLGEDAVRAALAHYDRPRDPGFLERVRFRAACLGVYLTVFGVKAKDESDIVRGKWALELSLP